MYSWIVFAHVLGVFGFLLGHGAAAVVTLKLRGERAVERIRALLDLSRSTRAVANVSLLIMLAAGVTAGFMGNWWSHRWIWVSLAVLVVIGLSMTFVGARSLDRIRQAVQPDTMPSRSPQKPQKPLAVSAEKQLADLLPSTHPVLLTAIGGGGLALILWLMMFKPF